MSETTPETIRSFIRGFLAPTRASDPLGQTLAEGLLRPLVQLSDEAIEELVRRGSAERRAG